MKHKKKTVAPAEGERRAVTGYHAQYLVSASLVLKALLNERLEWIRIADPQAGHLDDFQIGSVSRVDAFQFKWSSFPGNFTFQTLIAPMKDAPSLIKQLTDGWQRLRSAYPGQRVVVHLITNDQPSVNDVLPALEPAPAPNHFSAFIVQAWETARAATSSSSWTVPPAWESAWEALRQASGLSATEFIAFVHDCRLQFSFRLPEADEDILSRDQFMSLGDANHIAGTLFSAVADPKRIVELTRGQLLQRLDWTERFEYRSRHIFPVDESLYSPIQSTIDSLERALAELPGGYVGVTGSPGSGKSTLLTATLGQRTERVIKYYAYVPDAQDPLIQRGESVNFLHDIVLALDQAGIRAAGGPPQFDRNFLLQQLHHQLQLLHEDFVANGRKTIILVDGLDHVAREQNPERSFLRDLPITVPDGVYLVLGTQTEQLSDLPASVRYAVMQPERHIEMQPLSRSEVFGATERLAVPIVLTEDQRERIYLLTNGHPLALAYLLNRLQAAADSDTVLSILDETVAYRGSIEEQYFSYWSEIEQDYDLVYILSLLSRSRSVIDTAWVERWADPAAFDRMKRKLRHYFRVDNHTQWYFFHNSFHLFIKAKTSEAAPGIFDQTRDHRYHSILAVYCSQEPAGSVWAWEELYHRYSAAEHERILELATQQFFRDQFLSLRPLSAIKGDIQLALRSATVVKDPAAVARLLLAAAEADLRAGNLQNAKLSILLAELGEPHKAIAFARDGNRLLVDAEEALDLSRKVLSNGFIEEAKRLFELAEPLDLLNAAIPFHRYQDKPKLLRAWTKIAVHLRPVDQVIAAVRRLRVESRPQEQLGSSIEDHNATHSLQAQLLYTAGRILLQANRQEDLSQIENNFDLTDPEDLKWWFGLQLRVTWWYSSKGEGLQAKIRLEEALQHVHVLDLDDSERTAAAELLFLISGDESQARSWLNGLSQPEHETGDFYLNAGFRPFEQSFRLNRLLYTLGSIQTAEEIVPLPSETRHHGVAYFERAVCTLARLYSLAWSGKRLTGTLFMQEALSLIRFYNDSEWLKQYIFHYAIVDARSGFYEWLVNAAVEHGPDAVNALRDAFEHEWSSFDESVWSPEVKRSVIVTFHHAGAPVKWVRERLQELQPSLYQNQDIYGCIENCLKQARAEIAAGAKEAAWLSLRRILDVSFGVDYSKDGQVVSWINWLGRINEVDPEQATRRIEWFAKAIVPLRDTTEKAANRAAEELLRAAFRWSPKKSIRLLDWLENQRIVWHEQAIRVLIEEALRGKESTVSIALFAVSDFLLPISRAADPELVELLVEQIGVLYGNRLMLEDAKYLVGCVDLYSMPSIRHEWKSGVAQALSKRGVDPLSAGITPDSLKPKREYANDAASRDLQLKDGTRLKSDEVAARCATLPGFEQLTEAGAQDSFFDWRPFLNQLLPELNREDVYRLAQQLEFKEYSSSLLADLSKRLLSLGDRSGAWSLGEKALQVSKPSGWIRWYDGGSRLAAFGALAAADPDTAREMAYETLSKDVMASGWYPYQVALCLEDILTTLTDEIPVSRIWIEVEQYAQALLGANILPPHGPDLAHKVLLPDSPSQAIADLLVSHLNHPIAVVSQSSQRACAKLLIRGNRAIQEALRETMLDGTDRVEYALRAVDAAALRDPSVAIQLGSELAKLYRSPNYAVRYVAEAVAERSGLKSIDAERRTVRPIRLPILYSISLESRGGAGTTDDQIRFENAIPDLITVEEITGPYLYHIKQIAYLADLPWLNICYRAIQIMKELAPEEAWSKLAEESLGDFLQAADLRFPYNRPRFEYVRLAVCRIAAELVDTGVITDRATESLRWLLRFYDPTLLLTEPRPRPGYVFPMGGPRNEYGWVTSDWAEQIAWIFQEMEAQNPGNLVTLAEYSKLKDLDWGTPTEVRERVIRIVTPENSLAEQHHDRVFTSVPNAIVQAYADIEPRERHPSVIVQRRMFEHSSPTLDWLALNPTVGYALGWSLSKNGLFQWVDRNGTIMVFSLWWVDGIVQHAPPMIHDEVGEGWLVLATPDAFAEIKAHYGALRRVLSITRSYNKDEGREQKSEVRETIL